MPEEKEAVFGGDLTIMIGPTIKTKRRHNLAVHHLMAAALYARVALRASLAWRRLQVTPITTNAAEKYICPAQSVRAPGWLTRPTSLG
jgi:hypothetical protein